MRDQDTEQIDAGSKAPEYTVLSSVRRKTLVMRTIEHVPGTLFAAFTVSRHVPTAGDVLDVLLKECCLQIDAVRVAILREYLLTAVKKGKTSNNNL